YDAPEMDGTGKHEPIAWTTQFGQGRVFFTALGHDVAAMTAPGFTAMFASAVVWAAGAVNKPADSERQPVRVTLVTGGHDHAPSFYSVFEGQSELSVRVNPHPLAYEGDLRKNCDVLVLYDMISDPGVKQKQNLREFLESGKGLVVLHHALVNFNS
ncbi:MAG: ThuA domain-containing protein, partial [Acidobacteriia bacterium]|nr:ThuA domain-containing protein [Terriglobia bacterium]